MMNRPSPLLLKSVEPSGSPSPLFFPLGESKVVDLFANNILHDIQQFKPKWLTRSNLSLGQKQLKRKMITHCTINQSLMKPILASATWWLCLETLIGLSSGICFLSSSSQVCCFNIFTQLPSCLIMEAFQESGEFWKHVFLVWFMHFLPGPGVYFCHS